MSCRTKVKFTHSGWYGLCPILIGDVSSASPAVLERYPFTMWLLDISEMVFCMMEFVLSLTDPDHAPLATITITSELKTPITMQFEYDEEDELTR